MKKYFIIFCYLIQTVYLYADNSVLNQANIQYDAGDYQAAISSYKELINHGYFQYEIFHNIGNCYFKIDSIGNAILYYEKALKLNSNDKNIKNNLKICNDKIINKQNSLN